MLQLASKQTAELYNHIESTVSYNILYASDEPNTIVSLCLDKKEEGEQTTFQFTEVIPVF